MKEYCISSVSAYSRIIFAHAKNVRNIIFIFLLLISAAYPAFAQYQLEKLDRGVTAVSMGGSKVFVSWRWLGTEDDLSFNLYRNGVKVNTTPLTVSNYTDNAGSTTASYTVKTVVNGVEQAASAAATPWAQQYLKIPLQTPAGGTTPDGVAYTYNANDASVADLDGDGQWEIILKWDPSNSKDNSQSGYTGNTYVDAYKMNGTRMWRIDYGVNIRSGAHYMDFMVYDFDGDGKAEVMSRTGDGTIDGTGKVIGTATADYRSTAGYVLTGPEYISVFNGTTGAVMATKAYLPARGTVASWGDSYGNRVDRFRAGVAYVDGQRPTGIFCRGYYTRAVVAAWDWRGGNLTSRWVFDSNNTGNSTYFAQGDHSISIADVDNDGKQEVIVGSAIIDDNGTGYYNTTFGHGDALHVSDLDPDLPGLEVFNIQERLDVEGAYMYNALSKKVLWTKPTLLDGSQTEGPGRGVSADISAATRGTESWVAGGGIPGVFDCKGNLTNLATPQSCNFLVWWDGDLLRELLNNTMIDKYGTGRLLTAYNIAPIASNNGTKSTPCLSGDIMGDWREEVIWRGAANDALYIFTTTTPSTYKFRTLMHDPQYRVAIAWQNTGYNQPPHLSYYMGDGMTTPAKPNITVIDPANACQASITTTTPTTFCQGGSIVLTATAGTSYKWFNGTTQVGTSNTYTATTAGSYTVQVTNATGCSATSAATTITINTMPAATVTAPKTSFCTGGSIVLAANTGTGLTYQWSNAAGTISGATAATYTAIAAGAYTVKVTNNSSCATISSVTQISVNTAPTASITASATSFCENGSAVLTSSTGSSYKWFNGSTQVGIAATYTATTAGAYTVEVANAAGCKATSMPVQISVIALPTAAITATSATFCAGGSVVLTSSPGSSYKWFNGTAQVGTAATYTVTIAGAYTVEVANAGGCKATSAITQISVSALPAAAISSSTTSFCIGGSVTLSANTGAGLTYQWSNAAGTIPGATAATYIATAAGAYTVKVTNSNACSAASAIKQISISTGTVWYADADGDGKGDPAVTQTSCAQPTGYVSVAGDACPLNAAKTSPGFCGCDKAETDTDNDGTPDCTDTDDDNDGVPDTNDCAPLNAAIGIATIWYQDADGDGKGDASSTLTACTQPAGYVSVAGDACPLDVRKTAAGNCGCGNTESSCVDCAGVMNGTALLDNCNICTGGNTGITACVTTATMNGTIANITVIPQPFDNTTTIRLENYGIIQSITVINASGALVDYRSNVNNTEITLGEGLAAGLYSVIIQTDSSIHTTKIVKK